MKYVHWPQILEFSPYGTNPAFCGASCPNCSDNPQEHQEKLTVAQLERLKGASRGAAAAQFDTAFRCRSCGTIYSFQNGVSFPLVRELPPRSLHQNWQLFLSHAVSSRVRLFPLF